VATGTQIEVVMPQMGVSVSEGTITKWLKQPGEAIAQDEALLEISTDKVDTEVPSPGDGVVSEILVGEGQTVEVGTVLAIIAPAGAATAEAAPAPSEAAPAEAEAAAVEAAPVEPAPAEAAAPEVPSGSEPQAAPAAPAAAPAAVSGNGKTFVSPVVARIASEHGVDPSTVPGTGTGGRVTKKDILAFIESGGQAAPAVPAPAAPPLSAPEAPAAPAPAPPAPAAAAPAKPAPQAPSAAPAAQGEVEEPMSAMRRGVM
jgi:pyruvate dehydrogenase E2 component (dihydrolipoamide acetyltransferase)